MMVVALDRTLLTLSHKVGTGAGLQLGCRAEHRDVVVVMSTKCVGGALQRMLGGGRVWV